jgi:hypothetical protein
VRDCDGGVAGAVVDRRASKSIIVGCDGSGLTVAAVVAAVVGADVLEVITDLVTSFVMELGTHKKTQAASAANTYAAVL